MDIFTKQGIIISAERAEYSVEANARRSANLVHALVHAVGWDGRIIPCTGCFEGVEEQSYVVTVNDDIAEDGVLARSMMGELMLIAHKFDQDAILVFHTGNARLLEIPTLQITGVNIRDRQIKEALLHVFTITSGDGLVSDLMHFEEVDQDDVEMFDLDYTEIAGRYYTLEA